MVHISQGGKGFSKHKAKRKSLKTFQKKYCFKPIKIKRMYIKYYYKKNKHNSCQIKSYYPLYMKMCTVIKKIKPQQK